MMSTDADAVTPAETRRLAIVLARYDAAAGAPPGIDSAAFAKACLTDCYELVADLVGVRSGIAGEDRAIEELLWPGALRFDASLSIHALASLVTGQFDELIVLPADVPDLPGLVVAKIFKALQRADVCIAPERGSGSGLVALGIRIPWPQWMSVELDLDSDPRSELSAIAPKRSRLAVGPDWHRMRTTAAIQRLDPGLEGWETTRALLSGRRLQVD
jgi:Guanylyl transferase CofC like